MGGMEWTRTLERLKASPDRWATIARDTGLPRMTVARIGNGETPSPRIDTAQKIDAWFAWQDAIKPAPAPREESAA